MSAALAGVWCVLRWLSAAADCHLPRIAPQLSPPHSLIPPSLLSSFSARVFRCVIHVASPSPTCRNAVLFRSVNIDGTKVLIDACLAAGVQRFVYTSSASVVFDGRDQLNLDETCPPPTAALDDYTMSKLAAEKIVLASNCSKLFTCAIRPHGIFGARDPHFLPVLAETGRKGKSKFVIGDGANLVDFTYVENVAYAHALAAVMLGPQSVVNGREYFITNQEPMFFWEFITRMQRGWGWTQPWINLPVAIMKPVAKMVRPPASQRATDTAAATYTGRLRSDSTRRSLCPSVIDLSPFAVFALCSPERSLGRPPRSQFHRASHQLLRLRPLLLLLAGPA